MASTTDIDNTATQIFEEYTADKMTNFLGNASAQLKKVAHTFLKINLFGGMGDGRENKRRGCYLSNKAFRSHLKGYDNFKRFVSASNVFLIQIYRNNSAILSHIIKRLIKIQRDQEVWGELNKKLRDGSNFESVAELFNTGT